MLAARQREARSVEWVAQFDWQAVGRSGPSSSRDQRPPSPLTVADRSDSSTLQRASRDGLVALFDGVLYDRRELQRALRLTADVSGDAALVLEAFVRWGIDFVHHIKGLFAVVVCDHAAGRLVAARDPFGEHPLFFAALEHRQLLLSPSIDALLATPGVRRTLNRAALADHLCQRWPDPGETFFEAVRRVLPGHRLISTAAGTTVERYWQPCPPDGSIDWLTEDDLDEFDARLEIAVERALSHGRSGILLSGGLDSVSVASAAIDVAGRTNAPVPVAYSLSYPPPSAEEPLQRAVASSLGMAQEMVPFWSAVRGGEGLLLTETLRLNQSLPVMLHSPWTPAYEHLMRMASRRGLQTLMTGCGGDEAFTAMPLYTADAMRSGNVVGLARHLAAWKRSYRAPASWYFRGMLWTYGLRALGISAIDRVFPRPLNDRRVRRSMQSAPSYVAPDPALKTELGRRLLTSLESKNAVGPLYLQEMARRLNHSLESQSREESFERGRRLGVRLSHPLRDADLAAMVFRMPQSLLYGDGRAKFPLRRRLVRRFPTLGFDRQKKLGATGFFRSILAAELPNLWRRTSLSALDQLGVVNSQGAADMVTRAFHSENTRSLLPVWELLKLEAWAESRI